MNWMAPKISLIYTGILSLFYFALSVNVIRLRWKEKYGLGHPSDINSPLFRAIRVHANFFEFVPFILLMLALDEMTGRQIWVTHALGMLLLVARIGHAQGITASHLASPGRGVGVFGTYLNLLILGFFLLQKGLM